MSLKKLATMLIVIAVTVIAWFVFKSEVSGDPEDKLSDDTVPVVPAMKETQNESHKAKAIQESIQNSSAFPDASRLVLIEDCPEILDPSVVHNQECMFAVEQHFSDRATYILEFVGMVPRNGRFSYQETLDNVESDRELVIEALSRPECQLLEGPIRLELRRMCNAEAIFRYSHFASMCNESRFWEDRFEWRTRPAHGDTISHYQRSLRWFKSGVERTHNDASFRGSEDFYQLEKYYGKRNKYRENLLKDIWLSSTGKCPEMKSEQTTSESDISRSHLEMLDWWLEDPEREDDISKLRHVAARLGFERELLNATCGFHGNTAGRYGHEGCLSREYEKSRLFLHPWSQDLSEGVSTLYLMPTRRILPNYPVTSAIIQVSRGLALMEESGFEAEIEWITKHTCGSRESETEDCQSAIERAENYFGATQTGALRILDRIAAKAIELNLYRN